LLSERIKHRRIDYTTGRTYHLPPDSGPAGASGSPATSAAAAAASMAASAATATATSAYSEPVRPLRPDGSIDREVVVRLGVRHDDLPDNVARRLALWDLQVNKGVSGSKAEWAQTWTCVPSNCRARQASTQIATAPSKPPLPRLRVCVRPTKTSPCESLRAAELRRLRPPLRRFSPWRRASQSPRSFHLHRCRSSRTGWWQASGVWGRLGHWLVA
jgi:hypothetical protein